MAKVAPVGAWVGEPPSADEEEEPKGAAANVIATVRGADGDGGDLLMERVIARRYGQKAEEYAALLSKVSTSSSSKRAKLMSVQGVLFVFTFMMSTFETSNR